MVSLFPAFSQAASGSLTAPQGQPARVAGGVAAFAAALAALIAGTAHGERQSGQTGERHQPSEQLPGLTPSTHAELGEPAEGADTAGADIEGAGLALLALAVQWNAAQHAVPVPPPTAQVDGEARTVVEEREAAVEAGDRAARQANAVGADPPIGAGKMARHAIWGVHEAGPAAGAPAGRAEPRTQSAPATVSAAPLPHSEIDLGGGSADQPRPAGHTEAPSRTPAAPGEPLAHPRAEPVAAAPEPAAQVQPGSPLQRASLVLSASPVPPQSPVAPESPVDIGSPVRSEPSAQHAPTPPLAVRPSVAAPVEEPPVQPPPAVPTVAAAGDAPKPEAPILGAEPNVVSRPAQVQRQPSPAPLAAPRQDGFSTPVEKASPEAAAETGARLSSATPSPESDVAGIAAATPIPREYRPIRLAQRSAIETPAARQIQAGRLAERPAGDPKPASETEVESSPRETQVRAASRSRDWSGRELATRPVRPHADAVWSTSSQLAPAAEPLQPNARAATALAASAPPASEPPQWAPVAAPETWLQRSLGNVREEAPSAAVPAQRSVAAQPVSGPSITEAPATPPRFTPPRALALTLRPKPSADAPPARVAARQPAPAEPPAKEPPGTAAAPPQPAAGPRPTPDFKTISTGFSTARPADIHSQARAESAVVMDGQPAPEPAPRSSIPARQQATASPGALQTAGMPKAHDRIAAGPPASPSETPRTAPPPEEPQAGPLRRLRPAMGEQAPAPESAAARASTEPTRLTRAAGRVEETAPPARTSLAASVSQSPRAADPAQEVRAAQPESGEYTAVDDQRIGKPRPQAKTLPSDSALKPPPASAHIAKAAEPALAIEPPAGTLAASATETRPALTHPAPTLQSSHNSTPPPPADSAPPSTSAERTFGIDQLIQQAQLQRRMNGHQLDMVLRDPQLGAVHVRASERAGVIGAEMFASQPRTAQALANSVAHLVDSLQQRGLEPVQTHLGGGAPDSSGRGGRDARDPSERRRDQPRPGNRRQTAARFQLALNGT